MLLFKTRTVIAGLLFFITFLTGCHTVRPPASPSASWTMPEWEAREMSKDPVWDSIRERKIEPDNKVALPEILDIALENNPDTREAWQNARARSAEVIQSQGSYYPQITADTGLSYDRRVANRNALMDNSSTYTFGTDVTMLILDFGGRSAGVKKARQLLLAANYRFNQAIQDLVLDTSTAYYSFLSSLSARKSAQDDVRDAEEVLLNARQRFKAGLVSKLDVYQAESTYNDSLFALEEAKGQVETDRATLAEVMGLAADSNFKVARPPVDVPNVTDADDVSRFIEEALKRRPDIAAARANLKAYEAEIDIATSNILPTLNAGGSVETNMFSYYGSRRGLSSSYKDDYVYGANFSVNWNVFDGLNNYFQRIEAQREVEARREELIQTEISASADVWTKHFNLKTAQKKYVFSEAFLASAKASHELAVEGYKAGLKSILDLLQSQSQLSEARSKLIISKKDLFVAAAELEHAMGALNKNPK